MKLTKNAVERRASSVEKTGLLTGVCTAVTTLLLTVLLALAVPTTAKAEWVYKDLVLFTNSVNNATNTTTSTNGYYTLVPNQPWSIMISGLPVNNGTSNVITGFDFTSDGTNFSTTHPLLLTNNAVSSNTTWSGWYVITNTAGIKGVLCDYFATSQTNANTNLHVRLGQWR